MAKTDGNQLRRITLAALARYEASGLIQPGDKLFYRLREKCAS